MELCRQVLTPHIFLYMYSYKFTCINSRLNTYITNNANLICSSNCNFNLDYIVLLSKTKLLVLFF